MAGSGHRRLLKTAALLGAWLFAQTIAISHIDVEDAHPAGEVCSVCIVQAQLGSASPAAVLDFAVEAPQAESVEFRTALPVPPRIDYHLARGPPQVS